MKRSPFFSEIVAHSPVLVDIQGWQVANEFTVAAEEHKAVRERVGLFDWSTTGEIEVQGPDALALVQKVVVNDASKMPVNRVNPAPGGSVTRRADRSRTGQEHQFPSTEADRK